MGHRPFGDCECNGTHACHRTISIRNYHVHTCKCYSAHMTPSVLVEKIIHALPLEPLWICTFR